MEGNIITYVLLMFNLKSLIHFTFRSFQLISDTSSVLATC